MPPRLQVDRGLYELNNSGGLQDPRAAVVASPVDTYVRPNEAATPLARLAEGLKQFSPDLERFAAVKGQQDAQQGQMEGEQAARDLAANHKTYEQAVKDGTMAPQDNPWFQVGYQEQAGRLAANQYASELHAAAQEHLQDNTDPTAFSRFEQNFKKAWLESNKVPQGNAYFQQAFGKESESYAAQLNLHYGQVAGENMLNQTNKNFYSSVQAVLQNERGLPAAAIGLQASGMPVGDPMQAMAQRLTLEADRMVAMNPMMGQQVNKTLAQAIADYAVTNKDPWALGLLDKVQTGPANSRAPLGNTQWGMDARKEAEPQIMQRLHADWSFSRSRTEYTREETGRATLGKALDAVADAAKNGKPPESVDMLPFIKQLTADGNPQLAETLNRAVNQSTALLYKDDPQLVQHVASTMVTGEHHYSAQEIMNLTNAAPGAIPRLTWQTALHLVDRQRQIDRENEADSDSKAMRRQNLVYNNPVFQRGLKAIASLEGDPSFLSRFTEPGARRAEIERVQGQFADDYLSAVGSGEVSPTNLQGLNKWITGQVGSYTEGYASPDAKTQLREKTGDQTKAPEVSETQLNALYAHLTNGHLSPQDEELARQRFGVDPATIAGHRALVTRMMSLKQFYSEQRTKKTTPSH